MKVAWNMVLKRKSKDALPWKAHFASMVLPDIACLLSGKVWWVEEGNRSYCKILKGAEFSICFTVYFFFFYSCPTKAAFPWEPEECVFQMKGSGMHLREQPSFDGFFLLMVWAAKSFKKAVLLSSYPYQLSHPFWMYCTWSSAKTCLFH